MNETQTLKMESNGITVGMAVSAYWVSGILTNGS
jgi:hypothetical protein